VDLFVYQNARNTLDQAQYWRENNPQNYLRITAQITLHNTPLLVEVADLAEGERHFATGRLH
jgi:hypothetical protein